ncbi:MAG: radical SAM protein, partial [Polyangiaceae bacterium]|nr:radical SAM protein [Polyangiaceae bacterium]
MAVRSLPVLEVAPRRLPLADAARPIDRACRPIYAVWELTLRCDLSCVHCGSRAKKARPDELTTTEALDLVRQMAELGVREVSLIGGEAYLRDDFLDIVRAVRAAGMMASLTTGGLGVDRAMAAAAFDAGLQAASVSVDGLPATHDAIRGVLGSYDAALRALDAFREAGIRITANTQLHRANLTELEPLFEELARAQIRGWQIQITVAMGRAAELDDLLLEPFQMLELMPALARIKTRADELGVLVWPGNNVGYFGPYETDLRGAQPLGHTSSCGAGRSTLGIESNGDIKGCPSLPTAEYVGGNVRSDSLRAIWERADALRFTRDRTSNELWGFCAGCYYRDECKAGCSWTSHSLFGRRGNNPFCHHRALELLARGERERVRRFERPAGLPFDHGRYEIELEPWPADELEQA